MSASEKLRALEFTLGRMAIRRENVMQQDWLEYHETNNALQRALPQIIAVVEAAENPGLSDIFDDTTMYPAQKRLAAALAALDEALS